MNGRRSAASRPFPHHTRIGTIQASRHRLARCGCEFCEHYYNYLRDRFAPEFTRYESEITRVVKEEVAKVHE